MSSDIPLGERYDLVYVDRGPTHIDHPRLRERLQAQLSANFHNYQFAVLQAFHTELGLRCKLFSGIREWDLSDVLAGVTIAYRAMAAVNPHDHFGSSRANARQWRDAVAKIFSELNVGYIVDQECGVHPAVDAAFQRQRASAIKSLGSPRYEAVRHSFESSFSALDEVPPDTTRAIRDLHQAVETLFKLTIGPTSVRLGDQEIQKLLKPIARRDYSEASWNALKLTLDGAGKWAEACNQFRHGQMVESVQPPPMDVTALILSTGVGFLRWLVELDQAQLEDAKGSN